MNARTDSQADSQRQSSDTMQVNTSSYDHSSPTEDTTISVSHGETRHIAENAKWWIQVIVALAVYLLGNVAFEVGFLLGLPWGLPYVGDAVVIPIFWMGLTFGSLFGLPAMLTYLVLDGLLSKNRRVHMSPGKRMLVSAAVPLLSLATLGYLFITSQEL